MDESAEASRYQLRLADLLIWTFVAGLIALGHEWMWEARELFWSSDDAYGITHAIRCGGGQCGLIGLAGVLLLLAERRRLCWFLGTTVLATGAALLAARGLFAAPLSTELLTGAMVYLPVGLGCVVAMLATLLPLRAWGWRVKRQDQG